MKNIINYLGALLAVALVCTTFTACMDEDDLSSANSALSIKVFFPTKVVTNQPMTINGSGFLAATEIVFPGGAKVTDFEVVSNDMIRVNVPSGIPAEGGKIVVRSSTEEAVSRLPLTLGHTKVTGFSKQPGEKATGGELITVFGSDLEFINAVELLDPDSVPQLIDQKDFYRKGTGNVIFRVPKKNIYKGTFVGYLHTFDGQKIALPELAYEPAAEQGHWETVKTIIWENRDPDGNGSVNWNGTYRFAPETNSTGEEIATIPQEVWEKMKNETFFMSFRVDADWYQIRPTTGWWGNQWLGKDNDISPSNMSERIIDNEDGTYYIEIFFDGDPITETMDVEHLLFTGSGYTPLQLYFQEEVWVDGGGEQEVKTFVWKNEGMLGEINWGGDYRFAPASNSTGEECYTVPQDVWDRLKTETFYVTIKGANPQIRVTSGWWSTTWTGKDIVPGNDLLDDLGDGIYTLTVNLAGDPLLDVLDAQHLLFTGGGYTVEEIYFIDIIHGGRGEPNEVDIWTNDGSHGVVNWSGEYRFSNEECCTGEEMHSIPMDTWNNVIRGGTFYVDVQGESPSIRVTTGWWSTTWTGNDIHPGDERLRDNGDGTWTLEINFEGSSILEIIDEQHLLITGEHFIPLKLYYFE